MAPLDFAEIVTPGGLATLGQVIMIDLMLAGDNVVILGTLAAGLPPAARKRVLTIGVAMALVFLIVFALLATQLLQVVGLTLAGGLLLLWVAWKMYRELHHAGQSAGSPEIEGDEHSGIRPAKSFAAAAWAVAIADVSMSLDNVLAVAGAARDRAGEAGVDVAEAGQRLGDRVARLGGLGGALPDGLAAALVDHHRDDVLLGLAVLAHEAGVGEGEEQQREDQVGAMQPRRAICRHASAGSSWAKASMSASSW